MPRPPMTQEAFIEKANKLHNSAYTYENTEYKNMITKILVTCPMHGDFEVLASNHVRVFKRADKKHLKPCGCPLCGRESVRKRNIAGTKTTEQFILEAKNVHLNKYTYENVNYIHSQTNVDITCPSHGSFLQQPVNHLSGNGCPKCKSSKGEKLIERYLLDNFIQYQTQYNPFSKYSPLTTIREGLIQRGYADAALRGEGGGLLKFDFYLPEYNLYIEYDGEQHFKPVRFHQKMKQLTAEEMLKRTKIHDKRKDQFIIDSGSKLLRIKYNQLNRIEEILTSLTCY